MIICFLEVFFVYCGLGFIKIHMHHWIACFSWNDWWLAVIQGVSESFPISSSAHIMLASRWLGLQDNPQLEVTLHLGSFLAMVTLFRADLWMIACALFRNVRMLCMGRNPYADVKELDLATSLAISTLPAVCVGFFLRHHPLTWTRSPLWIAVATVIFGFLMYVVDRVSCKNKLIAGTLSLKDALFIGSMQVLAFLPGVSRLGICLTAARMQGYTLASAVRYGFLLGIGSIGAALTLKIPEILHMDLGLLLCASGITYILGLGLISFFMRWIKEHSIALFAFYRILLGGAILALCS